MRQPNTAAARGGPKLTHMTPRSVSVLGSGWLGLALAERLAALGLTVRASTTAPAKLARITAVGATPHRIAVGEEVEGDDLAAFFGADAVVFTLPPSAAADYPVVAAAVRDASERHGAGWLLMTSSTSVHPDLNRTVAEADAGAQERHPLKRNGPAVLAAEEAFRASDRLGATVLRLAGLYGHGRHPARSLAGRTGLPGGASPVNLVHRDDAVGAIEAVLREGLRGETLNVCADEHPRRDLLYPAVARALGLAPPTFSDAPAPWKRVSNARLKARAGYRFRHPDPLRPPH